MKRLPFQVRGHEGDIDKKFFLTYNLFIIKRVIKSVQALNMSLIGNPVKIGDGPAAVVGDERCKMPLSSLKEDGKAQLVG